MTRSSVVAVSRARRQERRRVGALAALLVLACGGVAVTALAEASSIGGHACEAARSAGIQGSDGRYAGRIELPPAEQRFSAEIRRLAANRPGCRSPKRGATHEGWWQCGAVLESVLSKYPQPLRSDDGYIFHDRLSGWFHLADDGRYTLAYTDFAGNYFIEEGRCVPD
jgi:hypothetical protein